MFSCLTPSLISLFLLLCLGLKSNEVEGINVLVRATRNAEGSHEECCGRGRTQFTEEEKRIFVRCSKRYEDVECSYEEKIQCVTWCVASRYEIVDDKGYVKGEVFQSDMKEIYPEECLKKLVTKHGKNCTDIANDFAKAKWEGKNTTLCNPSATLASRCLINNVDMECPQELKSQSEICEKRREHLKQMKERY